MNIPRILWQAFNKYRWHIALLVVLGFLGAILEGIGINATIPLISFLVNHGAPTDFISRTIQSVFSFLHITFTFRYLLALIVGLFISRALATILFGYIRGVITSDFQSNESEEILRKTFHASWPFLLKQKLGFVHNTLVRDIQLTSSLLEVLGQAIQSFTGFLMYLVVALNISPRMTLATLVAGAVLLGIVRPLMRRMQVMADAMSITEKKVSQFLSEHVLGMKAVKASGAEEQSLAYSHSLFAYLRQLYIKKALVRALSTSLFQPFSIFFVIILFTISYRSPDFNLLSFAATLYLIQKIFTYLESGQSALGSMSELVPYARNVLLFKELLTEHTEVRHDAANETFAFSSKLEFANVSLHYQGEVAALADVSFSIAYGETVGLIGPSGAGKTTIADLLLRLFEPTGGDILVDGTSLSKIDINQWRSRIGYVAQDIFLLNDTIEENIRFYFPDLSHDDIVVAAKQANIYDFVMSLKDGFQTLVGDRGVMLSGGQRQRVVLARALARKPSILLLDEATSALDTESEKLIQHAIYALRGHITVLIIAHRLSTIEKTDRVIVLVKGRVVEQGSPQALEEDTSSYYYRVKHGQ